MFPTAQLGPAAVPVAPIVLLIGVFMSASLVEKQAERLGLDRGVISNLLYIALGAALVGARVGYVLTHLSVFLRDPVSMVVPTPTTLEPLVGLLVGIGAGAVYGYKYGLPLWRTLDALAPGIAAMGLALGVAHLASGDAFGAPARLPWSIHLWDEDRHPSQVYEILSAAMILGVWLFIRDAHTFDGFQFLGVVALFAASVILLEAFRGDSVLFQGWRVAQVIALAILALSLLALRVLSQHASSGPIATIPKP